jgi:hypothetical protein
MLRFSLFLLIFSLGIACGGGSLIGPPIADDATPVEAPLEHVVNVRSEGQKTIVSGNILGSSNIGDSTTDVVMDKPVVVGPGAEVELSSANLNVKSEMRIQGTLRIR